MKNTIIQSVNQLLYQTADMEPVLAEDSKLREMILYSLGFDTNGELLSGGKRLRPLFCALACAAVCGDWQKASAFGCGLEMLHNFSLIHDDIEDNDDFRHNRPTLWKKYGLALSLNAGDLLFAMAYETILTASKATGSFEGLQMFDRVIRNLTLGQHRDISFETADTVREADYLKMVYGKTASLFGGCCALGAIAGGADTAMAEDFFEGGVLFGLAFQIRDDYLGIWGDEKQFGKSVSSDICQKKRTLPILYTIEHNSEFREAWQHYNGDESEVEHFRQLMSDSGADVYVQQRCADYTRDAEKLFARYQLNDQYQSELAALIASLLNRNK